MKKELLLILIILIGGLTVNAQFYIMPKAGTSISHMNLSTDVSGGGTEKAIAGFTGGAALEIKSGNVFSFQPELLYVSKGYSTSSNMFGFSYTYTQKVSYLEMPLLAKFSYTKEKFRVFGLIGPSLAYGLGGQYKYTGDYTESGTIYFKDTPANYNALTNHNAYYNSKETNQFDLGLQVGGGIGYEVGPGIVTLDARYGTGFINLYNKAYQPTTPNFNNTSTYRVLAITLGYAIKIAN
jgi:hypothetical protein